MSLQRSIPDLPTPYRGVAFRAIEAILREDPVLASVVKTWRSRQGQSREMNLPAADEMPMIGLSPIPSPAEVMTVDHLRVTFAVRVTLFVRGTCFEDIAALWEAVEDAVRSDKPFRQSTVAGYLCGIINDIGGPAGVMRLVPRDPAFFEVDYRKPPSNLAFQIGSGSLTCFFRRPTRVQNPS